MGGITDVKFVPVEICEDSLEQGAANVLKEIRPEWITDNIQYKLLTDGITNKLVKCYLKDNPEDVVLVRVYGQKTDMLIDRKAETRNIILFHNVNLAPQLYATFQNGLAYEYVPGVTLTTETVIQPHIYSLVAAKMAQLHSVKPQNINAGPVIFDKIQQFYDLIPDKFSDAEKQNRYEEMDYIYPKSKFLQDINSVKDRLVKLNSPVVFAHNDLLLGNVIYNCDTNSVTFIDYEYAAMNYQAFDIANHFAEFQGVNLTPETVSYPDKNLQLDWLRVYLRQYSGKTEVPEEEVEELYTQVNQFVLAAHILWGLWALVQAEHSNIDFDYLQYGKIRLSQYLAAKEEMALPNCT